MTAPFDGIPESFAPAPAETAPDLTHPSLEGLAWVLEHPEAWPRGWVWDFSRAINECGTAGCALGIATVCWPHACERLPWIGPSQMAVIVGAPWDTMVRVFQSGMRDPSISPQVVAARIRDHLAGRPIRYLVAGDRDREAR